MRMLSIKRLFQIILIILTISMAFLLVNINNSSVTSKELDNQYKVNDMKFLVAEALSDLELNQLSKMDSYHYIIVHKKSIDTGQDNISDSISNVIEETLTTIGLEYTKKEYIEESDLINKPILLFCDTVTSKTISLELLSSYIREGGLALFSAGFPEHNTDSYLYPVWGLIEKSGVVVENEFYISPNFLSYEESKVSYSGYNASTSIKVMDDINVMIHGKDSNPILYSKKFHKGNIVMINGTFMRNKNASGIFCAALGELSGNLVYPIIGSKTVFVDGLTLLNEYDEKKVSKIYGRSSESFVRDVLWPAFLEQGMQKKLKYSTTLKVVNDSEYSHALSDDRQLIYLVMKMKQSGGELMYREDRNKEDMDEVESYDKFHKNLSTIFPHYIMNGYSIRQGKLYEHTLAERKSQFPSVTIWNGTFFGNDELEEVQNFSYKDGFVTYPIVSSGYKNDKENTFNFLSALTYLGVVSHSFDIPSITQVKDIENSWDNLKEEYKQLNQDYFGKTRWLDSTTLTEGANKTIAYEVLDYKVAYDMNRVVVALDNYIKGQKFYFRSNEIIDRIEGGKITKISEVYYLIEGDSSQITIYYK